MAAYAVPKCKFPVGEGAILVLTSMKVLYQSQRILSIITVKSMTLTQTANLTKHTITISVLALILGVVSFVGYKIWYAYYLNSLPPVEEKPDTKFGLLPPLDFPQTNVSTSNFSYSLDTVSGGLPKVGQDEGFEKIIKVYFVVKSFATLLSSERSKALAEKFGITSPAQIISETKYRFVDQNKILNVDLDSGNFSYFKEATISARQQLDDDNKLVSDFEGVLNSLGVLKEDLRNGRTKVVLLKVDSGNLVPTQLRAETAAAQISLWPADVDKKPIFTPDFNRSTVNSVVVQGASNIENYLSLEFNYYQIDTTVFATYPIKTAEAAFEDLKTGKGVVIIEPTKPQISITSVYLGYYLSENYNPYLQPIFVFEGPNFVGYVPAVSSEFIETNEPPLVSAK